MRSLSRTLVWGTTLAAAGVLLAAGAGLYGLTRASLIAQFDRALMDKARLLASTVEAEADGGLELEFREMDMSEFQGRPPQAYLAVWNREGRLAYRSARDAAPMLAAAASPGPGLRRVRLPDGRPGRAVALAAFPRGGEAARRGAAGGAERRIILALARSTAPIDRTLAHLRRLLLLIGLASLAALAGVLPWVVRRSLRPLDQLAEKIAGVREDDLHQRVRLDRAPAELEPVVEKLNELLGRLQAAFEREQLLSANVAHELRNPLAGMQLKLDVAASRSRTPEQYARAIRECRAVAAQMNQMVEKLLSLTRLEAGHVSVRRQRVALTELCRDVWEGLEDAAQKKRLRVRWATEDGVAAETDRQLVRVVVHNLLENAVAHAEDGGEVGIAVEADGDRQVRLRVTNTAANLTDELVRHCFERFWRADPARSDTGVRCGLGLSLVRKITDLLGGRAEARITPDGSFQIEVILPAAD